MTKHVGRRGTLAFVKEATRGVVPSLTNAIWVPRSTISFDDRTETAREQEGLGRIADSDSNFVVQQMAEGEVESMLDDKALGIILTSLFGASPTITGSNPYTHTYALANTNQHQSLSVLYQDPDITSIWPMAVVDKLTIKVETNGIVMYTVGFKSRVGRDWTTQTASFTSLGQKFLHQHLVFKLAANIAGLGAASKVSLKSLELTINANTKFDSVLGTIEPQDILNQSFSVEGTLNLNKEDQTYRRLMLGTTYQAVDISFIRTAGSSSLQLQLPRVDFNEWEQDRGLDDIVSQSINFKGNYDAANALDIISTCVLKNTYAGTGY